MSEEHLITWVGNPRDYRTTAGHELVAYELKVENDERVVEWSRKVDSPAPKVGELTPYADIVDGSHGPKLRVDWDAVKNKGSQRPSQPARPDFKGSVGPGPTGESQDARQRSIVRQHSQEMSLRFLDVGAFPAEVTPPEFTPEWLEINLQPIIDWFVADANGEAAPSKFDPNDSESVPF